MVYVGLFGMLGVFEGVGGEELGLGCGVCLGEVGGEGG